MAGKSPTQNSLKQLREEGWSTWIVEYFNPHSKTRIDLWNFGDIIAQQMGEAPMIVQTTSYGNVSARVKKILDNDDAYIWVANGGLLQVHGWRKVPKKKGSKQLVWRCRVVNIYEEDFD